MKRFTVKCVRKQVIMLEIEAEDEAHAAAYAGAALTKSGGDLWNSKGSGIPVSEALDIKVFDEAPKRPPVIPEESEAL